MTTNHEKPIIFLAFANDRADRVRYLRNLPEEARRLRQTLQAAQDAGLCQVEMRTNATLAELLDVFQNPQYRNRIAIFHYAGHANGYQLLFETTEGEPAPADAAGFGRFLGEQARRGGGLQLVFLNGCATQPQVDGLLAAGVSAVIATSQDIDDATATNFADRFYKGLAAGAAIESAFKEATAALEMMMDGNTRAAYLVGVQNATQADRWPWNLYAGPGAELAASWNLPDAVGNPLFGLPPLPELDLPESPYRHLNWYRREDAEVFFGRGREIRDLYERVTDPAGAPIILFYGQSGVGKSSLLAAGLLPRLEGKREIRYLRREQDLGLLGALQAELGGDVAAGWEEIEGRAQKPLLVILDQVEERYTRPRPDDPTELASLLAALQGVFARRDRRPQGKLILAFRKEWLAEIEKQIAEHKLPRSKVFLQRLDRSGIVEVVNGPAHTERLRKQYHLTIDDPLPQTIAADLLADRGSSVAPTLQILLSKMWAQARERNYDEPLFDDDLYHELRTQGLGLGDFLDQQLAVLGEVMPAVVESGLVLDLLAYHTTPLGTAEQRSQHELQETYGRQKEILPDLVQHLQRLYLLVDPAANQPDKPPASRLAHDTLAPLVRARFDESDAPGQRARRILESRAMDWTEGRARTYLDGADLHAVEIGKTGMRELSQDEMRLLSTSRALAARKRRNQRIMNATLGALMLIVAVIAFRATLYPFLLMQKARLSGYLIALPGLDVRMEAYEVTNQRYRLCVNAGVCSEPSIQLSTFSQPGTGEFPITGIDAWQAVVFCNWINRRLPTLDEWEYAKTRGGAALWPWGDQEPSPAMANLCYTDCETFSSAPHRVGSHTDGKKGGIYDLIGNVFEWTRTEMDENMNPGSQWVDANPTKMPPRLAVVGGSYLSTANSPLVAGRLSGLSAEYVGVRCVEPLHLKPVK